MRVLSTNPIAETAKEDFYLEKAGKLSETLLALIASAKCTKTYNDNSLIPQRFDYYAKWRSIDFNPI